jgi:large subunit ribosomal protein L29
MIMKNDFIKELTNEELHERILEEKHMNVKLTMNHAVSSIENPLKIKASRKLIARLLTEKRAREIKLKSNA